MIGIRVEHLQAGYHGKDVLADLGFAVEAGQVHVILGPNGAGKTTLLRAIARLLRPSKGTVYLGNDDVWRISGRKAATRLALAAQSPSAQAGLTVQETVSLGRAPHRGWFRPLLAEDRAIVEEALENTGLIGLRDRYLDELSGGEQRRVGIARALAQRPDVLLLDEPTAFLDLRFQTEILTLVRSLAREKKLTVVMTLHDLNEAALYADRLLLVSDGLLLAQGTAQEVFRPEIIEAAYGIRVDVSQHPVLGTPLITAIPPSP